MASRPPAHVANGKNDLEAESRSVPCPKCLAETGEPCETSGGKTAQFPHIPRIKAARKLRFGTAAEAAGQAVDG